jgi:hypothetical protein
VEGTSGAVAFGHFREWLGGTALQGSPCPSGQGKPGELILSMVPQGAERGRFPSGRRSQSFSRMRAVSVSDRRCLGRTAWGKSTSATEVEVGVERA